MNNQITTTFKIDITNFITNFSSKHTQKAYVTDLSDFFEFMSGLATIDAASKLNLGHFISYRDTLQLKGMSKKTVARKLASIRSLMQWLVNTGHLTSNPASGLKVPTADVKTPTSALSDEEVMSMLELSKEDKSSYLILQLLFILGLRRSELLNLKASDFFEEQNSMVVNIEGKGGKTRFLPLNDELKELITAKLVDKLPGDYLFQNGGFKIDPSTIYRLFKKYAKAAGIVRAVSPHSARATAATKALESNVPITQVANDLGHSDINTTQIYWKRRKGLQNSMVHKINYRPS